MTRELDRSSDLRRLELALQAAGLGDEFDAAGRLDVVEDHIGVGSTDFWGISFAPSSFEQEPMGVNELDRKLTLLRAACRNFDQVAARVSPELRLGRVTEPPFAGDPVPVPLRTQLAQHGQHANFHAPAHELVRGHVLAAHERVEVRTRVRHRGDHAHHVLGGDLALAVLEVPAADRAHVVALVANVEAARRRLESAFALVREKAGT